MSARCRYDPFRLAGHKAMAKPMNGVAAWMRPRKGRKLSRNFYWKTSNFGVLWITVLEVFHSMFLFQVLWIVRAALEDTKSSTEPDFKRDLKKIQNLR